MNDTPNTSQADRDALDDHDVVNLDDRTGAAPHAVTIVEVQAQ